MQKSLWKFAGVALVNIALSMFANWLYELAKTANWGSQGAKAGVYYAFIVVCHAIAIAVVSAIVRDIMWDTIDAFSKKMHEFVHRARDLFVMIVSDRKVLELDQRVGILPSQYEHQMEKLLDVMAAAFSLFVPRNTEVFTSIRERQADHKFYTVLRGGQHRPDRGDTSEPVAEDSPMYQELTKAYNDKQDCVILTGPGRSNWKTMHNDQHGEDAIVLMGAVFTKVWNSSSRTFPREHRKLEWILCVAANRPDVFNRRRHFELMKCFNDVFGIFLNWFVRCHASELTTLYAITANQKANQS